MKYIFSIFLKILSLFNFTLARSMNALGRKRLFNLRAYPDFVRYSSLELVAEELNQKQILGNIAELGVYKGKFAKELNRCFTNRKLYLFDTFQGFDKKDIVTEKESGYSTGEEDFSNTSVELVLKQMVNPENCIIKKGFFPSTAEGIEDTFAFVSLDADLYDPIYSGLKFFYPKLSQGGYIFVHDYNNDKYIGAKEAVKKYCGENSIPYFPLSDGWGTCVILK